MSRPSPTGARTDVDERVLARVGYGPDRSDPNGQDWTWSDAAPNDGYDGDAAGERNNDEYFRNLTINGEGQYDFAIRFSVDRGRTWTVCDLDGAQNGTAQTKPVSHVAAAARNECDEGADNCDDNATCFDLDQGFRCECNAGFGGDGVVCADVNECLQGTDDCGPNSTCVNNVGGFDCVCDDGYIEEDGECKADPACEIPENICERRCNGEDLQIPERCPVQPECPECCQAERDCAGVCGGPSVQDENGVCCLPAEQDCADICGGAASEDQGGCCLDAERDCAGVCGGNAQLDCAGECNGDAVVDCNNVCNGAATQDDGGCCVAADRDAGVCDGTASQDAGGCCTDDKRDCAGVCDSRPD